MSIPDGTTVRIGDGPEIPFRDFERAARGARRMRQTPEDEAVRDRAFDSTAAELLGFIERVEAFEVERKQAQDEITAVFAEAKSRGFDTKALKVILAERKADKDKLAELHAVLDTYRSALGM